MNNEMCNLFNRIKKTYHIKSDAKLARSLDMTPAMLCKLRSGKSEMPNRILIVISERIDIPLSDLKKELKLPALAAWVKPIPSE